MSDLIAEPTGEAIQGTDQAAHSVTKPAVEVTFAVNRPGGDRPLDVEGSRAARISAGIARLQASGATAGKAAEAPAAVVVPPAAPVAKSPEAAAVDEALGVEPAVVPDGEVPAEAAAEGEAAAEAPAEVTEEAAPEAKPDPVEVAAYKAELETSNAELALARTRLEHATRGAVSDDDRAAYIERPVDSVRNLIARMLGVKPDSDEAKAELAHLQRELTIEAVGLDSLPDDRKHQRTSERFERSERLKPLARTASSETTAQVQQHQRVVSQVASVIEATRDEFPHLATAAALIGGDAAAEGAISLWVHQVKAGRIQGTGDDAKDMREALRLSNQFYSTKLGKTQHTNTAPPPATAPAPASATEAAPGAPAPTKSTAPGAKPGSATPKTLSAKQAAAAPIARAAPDTKTQPNAPITIDPNDRGARDKRRLEIGRRTLAQK